MMYLVVDRTIDGPVNFYCGRDFQIASQTYNNSGIFTHMVFLLVNIDDLTVIKLADKKFTQRW